MPTTHTVPRINYEPMNYPQAQRVGMAAPGEWLRRGWEDYRREPVISVFYGLFFAAVGWLITWASLGAPQFVLTFWTGFLLIGPMMAIGLYRIAQLEEAGEPVAFWRCWRCLSERRGAVALYMLLMTLVMLAWIRFSTLMVALYFGQVTPDVAAFTGMLFTTAKGLSFLVVLGGSGAVFALGIFAVSAISLPMILDRRTDIITSVVASVHVVMTQPGTMLLWAALVAGLTIIGMATMFIGLIVLFPVLGYATWHSYRDFFPAEEGR